MTSAHKPVWYGASNYAGPLLCLRRVRHDDDGRRRAHYCGRARWHDGPCACVCSAELDVELDAPTPAPTPPAPTPAPARPSRRARDLAELAEARAAVARARDVAAGRG